MYLPSEEQAKEHKAKQADDIAEMLELDPKEEVEDDDLGSGDGGTDGNDEEASDANDQSGDPDVGEAEPDDEIEFVDGDEDDGEDAEGEEDSDDGSGDDGSELAEDSGVDVGDDDDGDDDEELDEVQVLKQQNEQLLKLIEEGVVQQLGIQTEAKKPKAESKPDDSGKKEADTPTSLAEMIGTEIDFNEFQDDPGKFIELMQKVVDHTRQTTISGLQAELPQIINQQATQTISLQTMVDNFYRDNSDLAAVKKTVSAVAQSVGAEHPDWEMPQLLQEAAARTRKLLGVPEKTKTKSSKPQRSGKKPAIPKAKGKRSAAPKKLTEMQKQINDIIDLE